VRVLHLSDHYLPVLGGIETHVAGLANRQAARGDEVTVLTSTPSKADEQHADDSGPVTVRRVRSTFEGYAVDFTKVDVIHVHVSVVAPFSAPLAALAARRGVPTVVTVHSLWSGLGPVATLAAGLAGLRTAPVIWTAVSRVAADQLTRRLPRATSVHRLSNAVDIAARPRSPVRHPDGFVGLVSTMRIARRKRPMQLLDMFEALHRSVDTPLRLTIVGDGPLRARLQTRIRQARLQDVVSVTGRVEPSQVRDLLARADIYVAPAILESFGLAALEARCVGLPVVGHAATGMTEFVQSGVEGLLCTSDADMVSGLSSLVINDDLRARISEYNRTVPSIMTWERALEQHTNIYRHARSRAQANGRSRHTAVNR
jgi:glycosyltransferase involved in cell wall biosynthesis